MEQLARRLTPTTLFLLSMNGIIGSGWLFAPLYAAKIAGPAAIISWIIGGVAALLISLTFAELSTMLPVAGGTAHIPQLSHGTLASFVLSWIAWITSLMLTPIEVQAVLQYAAIFFPVLMNTVNGIPHLSLWGYLWAAILMFALSVINIISFQGLVRFNLILCIIKFFVLFITIYSFIHVQFNSSNFAGIFESMSTVSGWQAIFSAVATGGIVLAFNGFKSGVELAGETKNLAIAIPLGTVGTVFACLILYLGLQICFIGALDTHALTTGWQHLSFTGDLGPFVGLGAALGLIWLVKLLYMNAVVSPLGAGLVYVTATARILYAMSRIGYVPKFLSIVNKQHFPTVAISVNFVLGMLTFLPLPGWQAMVNFLISTIVITYAMGPIALLSLRYSLPDKARPFKLPCASFICWLAFYSCNLFCYWTGWQTISKFALVLGVGFIFFAIAWLRGSIKIKTNEIHSALWILFYLGGLILISYLGEYGGKNMIKFGWDFVIIALFTTGILQLAIYSRSEVSEQNLKILLAEI